MNVAPSGLAGRLRGDREQEVIAEITEQRWLALARALIVAGQPCAENPLDPDMPPGREEGVAHVVARIYDPKRAAVYERLGIPTVATVPWTTDRFLRMLLPEGPSVNAVTWDPVYGGAKVTRSDWWFRSAVGAQRVLREWRVIPERLANGSLKEVELIDGSWR